MKRVAIVGAGISGLATAHYLEQELAAAGGSARITLFEAAPAPGGTMRTVSERGFLMERGPNGFLTNRPHALELAGELGISQRLLRSSDSARRRFLFSSGRLQPLPETPPAFLRSGLLSWSGRLRVLAEPWAALPQPGKDESVARFACRRLGREAMEKMIEPMTAGVFAGNPDELSLRSSFPRIHELETRHGGLMKAMLKLWWERRGSGQRREMTAGPGGVLHSFDRGMETLIQVLARKWAASLRLGMTITAISRRGRNYAVAWPGGEFEAEAVIVSAPAFAAARLLAGLDAALAAELSAIPYAPIAVVALGYDAAHWHAPEGHGFLVPRLEGRRILGALWDSSVFAGRAPAGRVLARVMVGGARQPDLARLPEPELARLAREELSVILGLKAEPVLARVFFHGRGIPQYLVGHAERLERLAARLADIPGLYLNSNAYRGVSVNDCVLQSRLTARKAAQGLLVK